MTHVFEVKSSADLEKLGLAYPQGDRSRHHRRVRGARRRRDVSGHAADHGASHGAKPSRARHRADRRGRRRRSPVPSQLSGRTIRIEGARADEPAIRADRGRGHAGRDDRELRVHRWQADGREPRAPVPRAPRAWGRQDEVSGHRRDHRLVVHPQLRGRREFVAGRLHHDRRQRAGATSTTSRSATALFLGNAFLERHRDRVHAGGGRSPGAHAVLRRPGAPGSSSRARRPAP